MPTPRGIFIGCINRHLATGGASEKLVDLRSILGSRELEKGPPMSNSVHKGGCTCGKGRVEARGEPYRVGVCHCLTCRKLHGMPFSFYAVFSPDAVTIEGQVDVFASSEHGRRYFCPACGSQIYSHYSRPDEIYVYPGSFDETGLWEPTYGMWRSAAIRGFPLPERSQSLREGPAEMERDSA